MKHVFDPAHLRSAYDHCRLVPFIGSGMSRPACADWQGFVAALERATGSGAAAATPGAGAGLTERALVALQDLRRMGLPLPEAVRDAVYLDSEAGVPESTAALARIHWPLVCSTNYDELYLRACAARLPARLDRQRWPRIRVLGRCESDCRFLLQHLAFPAQTALWCIQGFLKPTTQDALDILDPETLVGQLESELVIGHAEYRKATHQAPHFRRAFAELFRSRSLLFLGSGLTEAYFRFLFDEIVELGGPPARPHFAFIPEGVIDPDFMLREYHILCYPYPASRHEAVTEQLNDLKECLDKNRVRVSGWSFGERSRRLGQQTPQGGFHVMRAGLPTPESLPDSEVVAISCGRGGDRIPGIPLVSEIGKSLTGIDPDKYEWRAGCKWVVLWPSHPRVFGIVARSTTKHGADERTPQAILDAFVAFLEFAREQRYKAVHVQLLAAGEQRVFAPWVSIVQMARAYGDWSRAQPAQADHVSAYVYVVDRSVLALMQGGFIDLAQPLQGGMFGINVDTYDSGGACSRHHELVSGDDCVGSLIELRRHADRAHVYVLPKPRRDAVPVPCRNVIQWSFRNLGLVPGSTIVIDFRDCKSG
jgi:hypothetical protein